MVNSHSQQPLTPFLPMPEILRTVALEVRVYDNRTLQTEMPISREQSISVFAEKSNSGHWLFSFWSLGVSRQEQQSVSREFMTQFWDEYSLLFAACVKAILQMENDLTLMSKLRVCSYDAWIERNFLSQWNGDISDDTLRIEILDRRHAHSLHDLFSQPLNHFFQVKPTQV